MNETCKGHEKHMCTLMKEQKFEELKRLARGAQYLCMNCGRAASKAEHLCKPERIV